MAPRRIAEFVTNKLLGIDVNERYSRVPQDLDRRARDVLGPADTYLEDEPSVAEWFKDLAPTRAGATRYVEALFPSASWIRRYNLRWLAGDMMAGMRSRCYCPRVQVSRDNDADLCAGITIGLVVVPQALAYASLAHLPPAFGLYTSFTGAILYWLFGTSKDIVIGVRGN